MDFSWLNDITNTKQAWVYLLFSLIGLYASIFFKTVEEKRFPKWYDLYLLTGSLPFVWGAALLVDVTPWLSFVIGVASERTYNAIRKKGLSFSFGTDRGLSFSSVEDDDEDEKAKEKEKPVVDTPAAPTAKETAAAAEQLRREEARKKETPATPSPVPDTPPAPAKKKSGATKALKPPAPDTHQTVDQLIGEAAQSAPEPVPVQPKRPTKQIRQVENTRSETDAEGDKL